MGSDFIPLRTLLSEMRAAEYMWYQTVACHLDEQHRLEARLSKKRLAVFDELMSLSSAAARFPDDFAAEQIFLYTIDRIASENGFHDGHYSHVLVELEEGLKIRIII